MATGMWVTVLFVGPGLVAVGLAVGWSAAAHRYERMPAVGPLMLPAGPYSAPPREVAPAVDPEATQELPPSYITSLQGDSSGSVDIVTGPRHRAP